MYDKEISNKVKLWSLLILSEISLTPELIIFILL